MSKEFLYIFLGGGTGSVLRYGMQQLLQNRPSLLSSFPWSTLCINLLGSLLIGLFYTLSTRFSLSPEHRLLLTTGLCRGFTTFSTFSAESLALLRSGSHIGFVFYVLGSILLCIAAVWIGSVLGRQM